jgi:hypothetical protein
MLLAALQDLFVITAVLPTYRLVGFALPRDEWSRSTWTVGCMALAAYFGANYLQFATSTA